MMQYPGGLRWLIIIWELIRGNQSYRFAVMFVRVGALLVGGPPVGWLLASQLFGYAFPREDDRTELLLAWAPPLVGLAMIGIGLTLYLKGPTARLSPSAGMTVVANQSFKSAVRQALFGESKSLAFEGFTDDELLRPLQEYEIEAPTFVEIILALRDLVRGEPPFPGYEVHLEGARVIVRTTNGRS